MPVVVGRCRDIERELVHPRQFEHVRAIARSVLVPVNEVDRGVVRRIQVVDGGRREIDLLVVVRIAAGQHPAVTQALARRQFETLVDPVLGDILLQRIRVQRRAVEVVAGVAGLIAQAVAARRRERDGTRVVGR